MNFFNVFDRSGNNANAQATSSTATPAGPTSPTPKKPRRRTGRTVVYSVRVSDGFKADVLQLMSELQREQSAASKTPRHITEGEVIERILEHFTNCRINRTPQARSNGTLSNEIWEGVHTIARAEKKTPAQVLEELVVQRVAELGLVPQKAASDTQT